MVYFQGLAALGLGLSCVKMPAAWPVESPPTHQEDFRQAYALLAGFRSIGLKIAGANMHHDGHSSACRAMTCMAGVVTENTGIASVMQQSAFDCQTACMQQ